MIPASSRDEVVGEVWRDAEGRSGLVGEVRRVRWTLCWAATCGGDEPGSGEEEAVEAVEAFSALEFVAALSTSFRQASAHKSS